MNRSFIVAWIVVFVVWMAASALIHGMLLRPDYLSMPQLFRNDGAAQAYFPLTIIAHLLMSGALVWIYARGAEARPWMGQGARFGIAVALLAVVPTYLIHYAVQPMNGVTVVKQIVFDGLLVVLLGVVAAFMLRDRTYRV